MGFPSLKGLKCDFTCHCHGGHGGINTGWDCQPVISLILYQDCSRPVLAAKIIATGTAKNMIKAGLEDIQQMLVPYPGLRANSPSVSGY